MTTTIPTTGANYVPPSGTSGAADAAGGNAGAAIVQGGAVNNVDLEKFYQDVLAIAKQYDEYGQGGGDDPLVDRKGAPRIDSPSVTFSANDMIDLLRSLRSKTQDEQLKASHNSLESARIKAEKNTEKQLEKIQEWVKKYEEANSKGIFGKIFGWIGKIFAAVAAIATVVAAAVATAVTGGAAAPLLALAVVGAISATMSLANAISQECGGPEISINSLIQHTVGKFLTDVCGVDPKVAENICKIVGGALSLACPIMLAIEPSLLGNMAQGIALLAGADEQTAGYIGMALGIVAAIGVGIAMAVMTGGASAAGSATQVANATILQSVKSLNTVITASSAVVSGTTQAAQGGLEISKAQSQKEAEAAIADKKELEAMMMKLQKQMEEDREEIKKIIQQIEESAQIVSKMIAGTTDSMTQIAMNMGSKATV